MDDVRSIAHWRRRIFHCLVGASVMSLGWAMIDMQRPASAAPLLPTCNDPVNCLVFDDFAVYSLPFLNTVTGTSDFDQPSPPGFLRNNAITIATGAGGSFNNNAFIDEPYDAPNSVPMGSSFVNFETISLADPNPDFPASGDNSVNTDVGGATVAGGNMWDATTAAVRSFFLPGEQMVIYFNLNEENKGGLDDGQDAFAWLQATLSDTTGVLAPQVFTLSGDLSTSGGMLGGSAAQTAGLDDILPTAGDLWAHIHGEICVDPANVASPLVHFGACVGGDPGTAVTVNQNLGADEAAFALFNQQLSDLVLNPLSGYDLISFDPRVSHIDNGFEQLFILPTCVGPDACETVEVPEPGTLALFGLALASLAFLRRRKLEQPDRSSMLRE